jgi:hypothetical protein
MALAPDFLVESLGGLDMFRITPRWPKPEPVTMAS